MSTKTDRSYPGQLLVGDAVTLVNLPSEMAHLSRYSGQVEKRQQNDEHILLYCVALCTEHPFKVEILLWRTCLRRVV